MTLNKNNNSNNDVYTVTLLKNYVTFGTWHKFLILSLSVQMA
jgi:hypothetical protein